VQMQDAVRRGARGIQERWVAMGPPADVTTQEASRAGAQMEVDNAVEAIRREVEPFRARDPGAHQIETMRRMVDLETDVMRDLDGQWDRTRGAAAAADAEAQRVADAISMDRTAGSKPIAPRGALDGELLNLRMAVDEIEHSEGLFPIGEVPFDLLGAIKRRMLGIDDELNATGSAAELETDLDLILGADAARQAMGGADEIESLPVGSAQGALILRSRLSKAIDAAESSHNYIRARILNQLKSALDDDLEEWSTVNDSELGVHIRDVIGRTREVYQRFRDHATGNVMGHRGQAPGDASVLDFYMGSRERAREYRLKFGGFRGDMIEHLLTRAYQASAGEGGLPTPAGLSRWQKSHADVLREFPEAKARMRSVEMLARSAQELGVFGPRTREAVNRGAVSIFIDSPTKAFERIRASDNPGRAMEQLLATMPDSAAKAGLRDYFWQWMAPDIIDEKVIPIGIGEGSLAGPISEPIIKPGAINRWLGKPKNRQMAMALFGEHHIQNMETLSGIVDLQSLMPTNFSTLPIPEQKKLFESVAGSGVFSVIQRPALRALRATRLIDKIAKSATDIEARKILARAMLDPTLANQLLTRLTRKDRQIMVRRVAENLKTIAPRLTAQLEAELAAEQQKEPAKPRATPPDNKTTGL